MNQSPQTTDRKSECNVWCACLRSLKKPKIRQRPPLDIYQGFDPDPAFFYKKFNASHDIALHVGCLSLACVGCG